ncbi:acyltransferase family protein [Chloroflexota bacterium]
MTTISGSNRKGLIESSARLYFLDWLRILAMLAIFLYHNSKIFDFDEWHIKNMETSLGLAIFVEFLDLWMMPLFFIISGAAVYYSLKSRTTRGFIKERSLRIALPWILLGVIIMGPIQVYLERVSRGEFTGTFSQFFPHYFQGFYGFGGNFAWMGMHLWYLMYLFFFSLIILPILLPRAKFDTSPVSKLVIWLDKPWALLLLFLPLAVASPLADMASLSVTREMGTWDVLSYLLFFVYGYLLFSNTFIQDSIKSSRILFLLVAIILTMAILALEPSGALYFSTLRAICGWSWVLALLGFGSKYLNFNNRFLRYANEAVLPFYILHQTVIIIIGFFVIQWNTGIMPKYSTISLTSFVAIIVIYELLVRRINILRFLFGMRLSSQKEGNIR